jgi:hypothetical protein
VLEAGKMPAPVPIGGGAAARKKAFLWFTVAAIAVIAAGGGAYWYFAPRHAGGPAGQSSTIANPAPKTNPPAPVVPEPPPDPWHGLVAGLIALEKSKEGNLIYAVGKLRNTSDHQRFGVKVELDVFDAAHKKVGTATDYTPSIDAGKEWKFKALVVDRTATSATLVSVKEE